MCFIISIIALVLCFNFYMAGNLLLALFSLLVSIFFIILMIKNIKYVKRLKDEKKAKKDDN